MNNLKNNRVLDYYQITYGSNGFVQYKQLISKKDWDEILIPIKKIIATIEYDNKSKENEQSKLLKTALKLMFGDYNVCFPEESPLHLSISTGILSLPKHQGGDYKVTWKKL